MHPSATLELVRLRRRIWLAVFCESTVIAACVLAALAGCAVLIPRLFDSHLEPTWTWLWIGCTAAVAFGVAIAWRRSWSIPALATQIDRRHGLGGLLIAGLERDAVHWDGEVERRVRESSALLPALAPRRWLARLAIAAAFVGSFAILPPPAPKKDQSLVAGELERIADDVELALEAGAIDEEDAEELRDRVGEMMEMLEDGQSVDWSDADGLAERLEHEESVRLDRLEAMRAELGEFAKSESATGEAAQQDLAAALEHATELGLLDDLPKELQEMLEKLQNLKDAQPVDSGEAGAIENAKLDIAALGLNADQLQALAKGLQGAVDGELGKLAQLGKLDADELEDLDAILAAAMGEGFLFGSGESLEETPGRGGVNRGRGDALLQMQNDTQGDTSTLDVKRLPPGVAAPREWSRVGMRRTSPELNPTRDNSAGSAGAAGTGRVTWRRRLAPRHREAVRRYFSSRGKQPPK